MGMRRETTAVRHRPAIGVVAADARRTAARTRVAGLGVAAPLAVLAALPAACSPAPPGTGAAASRPPSAASRTAAGSRSGAGSGATASPAATAAGAPSADCATSALKVALGPANGAAGSSYVPIRFTNVSPADCTLFGYPGVSFVTGPAGGQVGNAATRMPLPSGQPRPVPLRPGAAATAVLQVVDTGVYSSSQCRPADGPYLRIYPPGQTAALYVRTRFGPGAACASRAVTTLQIQPVQPGAGSASVG